MHAMKCDMAGAATIFQAIVAIAELGLPIKVTGWLCLAENMPGGASTRPGDVITMFGGKTVEVLNTDAEGRLVMADGLVAASAEKPGCTDRRRHADRRADGRPGHCAPPASWARKTLRDAVVAAAGPRRRGRLGHADCPRSCARPSIRRSPTWPTSVSAWAG